jgi:alpha-L-arabinofuranosidase
MYSTSGATTPVAVDAKVETYDVSEGVSRIPDIPAVPYLDVVAALNDAGDRLTLFAVNRHLHRDLTAAIRLTGFTSAAEVRIQTLSGTSIYQVNDELRPEAVHPVESAARIAGAGFDYIFPRASVTVLELRRR